MRNLAEDEMVGEGLWRWYVSRSDFYHKKSKTERFFIGYCRQNLVSLYVYL
jgi:hypothetical protein